MAEHDYQSITVYAEYDKNANTAEFDGIQLFKEAFGNTYSYDADGNIADPNNLGPHYHALLPEWDSVHSGDHHFPGEVVPEPWRTLYFGGQ